MDAFRGASWRGVPSQSIGPRIIINEISRGRLKFARASRPATRGTDSEYPNPWLILIATNSQYQLELPERFASHRPVTSTQQGGGLPQP
jgi:hypothetical protein